MKHRSAKLGVALVGLGKYSTNQLAPALQETVHCHLAGIVTGEPGKAEAWRDKYDIPQRNIYDYENFDTILDNPAIDIVYVVLPNSMHASFTIRAAKAKKHVICEKPMAITVDECNSMINACVENNVKLSIGYRLHFDPYHLEIMRLGQEDVLGTVINMKSEHGMKDPGGFRLNSVLAGGGPLMDLGIYCVQAAQYVTGRAPISVWAQEGPKTKPEKFLGMEQSIQWIMEFPNDIRADCRASYDEDLDSFRAETQRGWFELQPAFEYGGLIGKSSAGKIVFTPVNQQAKQMDDFALAIRENRPTPVPGEMGRRDVEILQAIYTSMKSGQRVLL